MELPLKEEQALPNEEEQMADKTGDISKAQSDNAVAEKDQEEKTAEQQEQAPLNVEVQCDAPQTVQQKQDNILNLNNEVVKMRKEVKRVRALIIRKLTRQIVALKKKKGKDADIERNQRRAARLLEEIHAIKTLVPDKITKTALQKDLNFEQVCKDPKASISDRAMARIATHPQFSKKIASIKGAVKTFKEERSKEGKQSDKMKKKTDKKTKKQAQLTDAEKETKKAEDTTVRPVLSKDCETDFVEACTDNSSISSHNVKEKQKNQHSKILSSENANTKLSPVKQVERPKPQNQPKKKKNASKLSNVPSKSDVEEESDLEFSDAEEKEYFDDSTEERFLKQSSGESEESDNDFFVGKVSKFKKKKTKTTKEEKVQKISNQEETSNKPLQTDVVQNELDELESRLKSKVTSLNSVFCTSLAGPKTGKHAGKGDRKFGRQYKHKDAASERKIDFTEQSNFHKGKQKDSDFKYSKPFSCDKTFGKQQKHFEGRGHGKDKMMRQKEAKGRSLFSHQASAQPLHPSWEASKKRKEQQGQILAFQGKKIKFNDDE